VVNIILLGRHKGDLKLDSSGVTATDPDDTKDGSLTVGRFSIELLKTQDALTDAAARSTSD